jgi:hypothetical protein
MHHPWTLPRTCLHFQICTPQNHWVYRAETCPQTYCFPPCSIPTPLSRHLKAVKIVHSKNSCQCSLLIVSSIVNDDAYLLRKHFHLLLPVTMKSWTELLYTYLPLPCLNPSRRVPSRHQQQSKEEIPSYLSPFGKERIPWPFGKEFLNSPWSIESECQFATNQCRCFLRHRRDNQPKVGCSQTILHYYNQSEWLTFIFIAIFEQVCSCTW